MSHITFFIITPSYNQAQFIAETVSSVTGQKGDFKVKLVIMDGGSTDGTRKYLQTLPPHIHWESKQDKGQTDAINKGIFYVRSLHPQPEDIIAYINSDDYYLPDAFQTVLAAFQQHTATQWLVGDAVIVNSEGEEIQKMIRLYKRAWRYILSTFLLLILNPIPQPAVFIKWSALDKTGIFDDNLRYVMDYDYWLRLYSSVGKPLIISSALAGFRIHGFSKGGSQFEKQFAEELEIAGRHSRNGLLLALHRLHNWLIVTIYNVIK